MKSLEEKYLNTLTLNVLKFSESFRFCEKSSNKLEMASEGWSVLQNTFKSHLKRLSEDRPGSKNFNLKSSSLNHLSILNQLMPVRLFRLEHQLPNCFENFTKSLKFSEDFRTIIRSSSNFLLGPWVDNSTFTLKVWALGSNGVKRSHGSVNNPKYE